jgi:transcriptional regulator with XRE-family HTH domain
MLREWRQRRRLSQLDLAGDADISTRHVSFVETGRSLPSREMLMRLAERLDVPLRERNLLMVAAGYAPLYGQRSLSDDAMRAAREAVELVLSGHEPYPALAIDRHWTLLVANRAVEPLLAGVDPMLLEPPVNVLRLSLHPRGLAPRILNLAQWRAHLLERLGAQVAGTADATLAALGRELRDYPVPVQFDGSSPTGGETQAGRPEPAPARHAESASIAMPLQLASEAGTLSLISTTTVFGTPTDVTLSELALESFFPADPATGDILRGLAAARS